jgi:dTDP-4-dehydrorhamnose reductase
MNKVFITGGTGKLGRELVKIFPNSLHPTHSELDITDKVAVYDFIKKNIPEIIIHTAAITSVRRCEEEKEFAWSHYSFYRSDTPINNRYKCFSEIPIVVIIHYIS